MSAETPSPDAPVQTGFADLGDIQVYSSTETPEQVKEGLSEQDKGEEDLSKAAAALGKEGGKAAARARSERQEAQEAADEQAEARPGDEAKPEDQKPTDKRKGNPRHDPTARVAQATREAAQARREAQELRARLKAMEAQRNAPQEAEPEPEVPEWALEPKEEDFETYSEWVKARQDWSAMMASMRMRYEMAMEQEQRSKASQYEAKIGGVVKSYSDTIQSTSEDILRGISMDVVSLVPSFELPPGAPAGPENVIADEIISSGQNAPALMLYLSEHPDDFQRIASLRTPREISREMAKLESRLDAAPPAPSFKPAVSKAPAPLKQVSGVPHATDTPPGDDATYEEHERYYNRVDREKRRRA